MNKIAYVSSYPPRECGIATFTKDLVVATNQLGIFRKPQVVAMNEGEAIYNYDRLVRCRIRRDFPNDYIEEFVWLLHQDTIMAQPSESPTVRLKDESDIPIVSAAMNAKADVFVTGDQELQNLGQIGTLRVLSPRQFWEKLRTQLGASEDE